MPEVVLNLQRFKEGALTMEPGRRSLGGRASERPLLLQDSPQQARINVIRKVQVIYYLARNGHLEHPHYMEVPHIASRHLRLKDVIDRLMVLRGRIMPSLYSWSCKRCYKNGYVWNDLAENDVVYPSEGGEYVLKGTELVEIYSEKLQEVQLGTHPQPLDCSKRDANGRMDYDAGEDEGRSLEVKGASFRCSKGVSTDEIEELQENQMELSLETGSPPATSSNESNPNSKRFEEDNTFAGTARNSGLLQFFCGSGKQQVVGEGRKLEVEEEDEICCMSLNPRFGNVHTEEKEFFSGTMAETMLENRTVLEPKLAKSSSYKEERSLKEMFTERTEECEEEKKKKSSARGRCIPRMICSSMVEND